MAERAIRDGLVRKRLGDIHVRFVDRLEALIARGIQEGDLRVQDPRAAALVLKAWMDGLAGQAAVGLPPDIARLSRDGIGLLLQGMSRPNSGDASP